MPKRRYPLTPLQKGMVYQSLRSPQSGLYVQQLAGRLREPLDVPLFKGVWSRLMARHAVLRTRMHLADESDLCQEVEPDAPPEWTEDDWSRLSPDEREARLRRFLDSDRRRAFDFSGFPLLRLALFRLADNDFYFVWTYHHAILDAPSRSRILEELFGLYDAMRRGEDYQPAEPSSFRAFAEWLTQQEFPLAKDFWLEFLKGFENPTRLDLPPQHAQASDDSPGRGHVDCLLSREDTGALRAFAARHDVTLGTLIQVSWSLLLSRYSGQDDVLFGATRACRHSSIEGAESTVGLLINTVPMRVQLPPDLLVLQCLKKLRADWVAMRAYEHTPLRDIQAWSGFGPEKPLFENILAIEDHIPGEKLQALGGDWQRREFELFERSDYPLIGRAYAGSRLSLRVAYGQGTLDDDAAARMLGHWRTVLMGLMTHADRRVVDLPLATDAEQTLMHVCWNDTQRQLSAPSCLHGLFEAQVARTPAAVALRLEAETVAYDDLNARANRLANYLQALGVGAETLVAICMARSPALIAAILAVLKSGGAYLPIDPDYPREQISLMLEDSDASVVLTESTYLHLVPSQGPRAVSVDSCAEEIARFSADNLGTSALPSNLAYAMYTSGSTGTPKLVGVEHRSAVNALCHTTGVVFRPAELAVIPFADSICFDASVYRIFSALSCGGSIVILDSILSLPYSRWAPFVTALGSAPSVLNKLLSNFSLPESVGVVTIGAEVAGDDLLARLAAYPQIDRVMNLYGPTEATIYCAFSVLMKRQTPPDASGASVLSRVVAPNVIGKPIWNAACHILDTHLRPVPIGVVGELHIGGTPVARGYLNDPALTARKFVPDSFRGDGTSRLYRTGDLAYYLPDGNIVFVGRMDDQIKVRGVRIEPQGIEAALNTHPDVVESHVRGVKDPDGEKQLVAYVAISPEDASAPEPAFTQCLRTHLDSMLPRHMVPGVFVLLDKLPRTSRGKLDVAALPLPDFEHAYSKPPFVAPRNDLEETLARIWQQVLRLDRVGIDDDFFYIGGDSLYVTQVINRVNHAFGVALPLRALFDAPTIASFADVVALKRGDTSAIPSVMTGARMKLRPYASD
jgi:amino acid adenylation domain-containing protein